MPYITKDLRRKFKGPLEDLISQVREQEPTKQDGCLNYLVSELVSRSVKPSSGWRYNTLHRAYGVFTAAAAEFYRRLMVPYEDKAIQSNGDTEGYHDAVRPQEEAGDESTHNQSLDKLLR